MASTIITKNSSTASATPAVGDLQQGELAVNVTDKKVYTKDSSAAIVKLVGSLGNQEASAVAITGGSIAGITDLAVADGGTGSSTAAGARSNLSAAASGANSDITSLSGLTTALSVAQGGTGVTSSTGSGSVVLSNSPTLVTPALGTPSAAVLTNATGLPLSTGISGLGTGVATFLGTPSSANLLAAVTDETGTGALVFANSPTLVTPALGTPASGVATNLTGLPLTTGVTGTLPIANGGTGQTTANAAFNALAPSQATASGKYLKSDGTNTSWDALDISTADITGTLPVANGGTGVTTSTGTGSVVLSNSPTLVTPALGTPSSATLTNATGLPISTGVSGLGTGVATALAVNVGSAGAPVVNGGALGTPSSGTVTNLTGTASININGTVGATTPTTGAFTTLAASSSVTLSGGTANGVTYLNGSKVLTSGSALTFDGTTLSLTTAGTNALTINTPDYGYLDLKNGTSTLRLQNNNSIPRVATVGNYPLVFAINESEQMRLTSTGLGIGTSSPVEKLTVAGSVSSSSEFVIKSGTTAKFALGQTSDAFYIYSNAAGAERLRLDSAGNLGLGVTPSAWGSNYKAMEFGDSNNQSFFYGQSNANVVSMGANAYNDNTNYKYKFDGYASFYLQYNSEHRWHIAPSGTAGNAITFTQAMTLDASGNLGVGTTSPSSKLQVNGTTTFGTRDGFFTGSSFATTAAATDRNFFTITFGINGSAIVRICDSGTVTSSDYFDNVYEYFVTCYNNTVSVTLQQSKTGTGAGSYIGYSTGSSTVTFIQKANATQTVVHSTVVDCIASASNNGAYATPSYSLS